MGWRWLHPTVLLLLAVVEVGCSGDDPSTVTRPELRRFVDLSLSTADSVLGRVDGDSVYYCRHEVVLQASGDTGAFAEFDGARLALRLGSDEYVDSLTADEIGQVLQVQRMRRGESLVLPFEGGILLSPTYRPPRPHVIAFDVVYRTGATSTLGPVTRAVGVELRCHEPPGATLEIHVSDSGRTRQPNRAQLTIFNLRLGRLFVRTERSDEDGEFAVERLSTDSLVLVTQVQGYRMRRDTIAFSGQTLAWRLERSAPDMVGLERAPVGAGTSTTTVEWRSPFGVSALPPAPVLFDAGPYECAYWVMHQPVRVTRLDSLRQRYEYETRTCADFMELAMAPSEGDSTRFDCHLAPETEIRCSEVDTRTDSVTLESRLGAWPGPLRVRLGRVGGPMLARALGRVSAHSRPGGGVGAAAPRR
jgi:hypothetical protein